MKWIFPVALVCGLVALAIVLDSRAPVDPGPMKVLEPELTILSTKETMISVIVPTVDPAARIGGDLWWQRWWGRRLDQWGIAQAAIGYTSGGADCLFWARWRDGRELCVPPEPPEAPPTGEHGFLDSGYLTKTENSLPYLGEEKILEDLIIKDPVIKGSTLEDLQEKCPAVLELNGCGAYLRR